MPVPPKTRFGPYLTPVFAVGTAVECEIRGLVHIVRLHDAPVPWPVGERNGVEALVVYKSLARALRQETPETVAACFDIPLQTAIDWQQLCSQPRSRKKQTKSSLPLVWKREEDELLTRLSLGEVARLTGRTLTAVRKRRRMLGLPDGRLAATRVAQAQTLPEQIAAARQNLQQQLSAMQESLAALRATHAQAQAAVGYWRAQQWQNT